MRLFLRSLTIVLCVAFAFILGAPCEAGLYFDPTGDTFGTGPVQIDLTSIDATYDSSSLRVSMTFANVIAPPSLGVPNSVGGFIDFDTDQNPNTGATSFRELFGVGPPPLLGDEYYADLFSESSHPGFVDIVDAQTLLLTGPAPIYYGTNDLSLTIPLSLLGGSDGLLNYAVIVGTFDEPTDEAPNGSIPGTSASAVPEPSSLVLSLSGLIICATWKAARMWHWV